MLVISIAVYLTAVWFGLDRRSRCSWDELAGRIGQGSGGRAALWNAGVLLQMIEYACEADKPFNPAQAEALRTESLQVRLRAIWVLTPWA